MTEEGVDYKVVSVSRKNKFKSVPLFLPKSATYDRKTNTVSPRKENATAEDDELVLVPNAGFDLLKSVAKKTSISCIACVGPYRTGKSLLLSRFLKDSKAFTLGPTLEGCTRGIWISTSAIDNGDSHYTFLLDCEGGGDPLEGDDASNARIALACILISSMFLFNNTGRPDRPSLQFLSYLNAIRKRIPENETIAFPSFLWVFRDFFLQLPNRKDTGKQYTLREYMLERVMVKQNRSNGGEEDGVVDSLLSDFKSFDVLSVGYPRRDAEPLTPEELSTLDELDWSEFDQEFRNNVQQVIALSLQKTEPFMLNKDTPANGPQFASWCQQVLTLVNSKDVLPNIPDMQESLLQSMADTAVDKAVAAYSTKMDEYVASCPVYNTDAHDQDLVKNNGLTGIAEEAELAAQSETVIQELSDDLAAEISSKRLLTASIDSLKRQCCSNKSTSTLSQLKATNHALSSTACDVLSRKLYDSFRFVLRADTTAFTMERFDADVTATEAKFRYQARGPAVSATLQKFFPEQKETDRVFLEKVHSMDALYNETVQKKKELEDHVRQKEEMVANLETNLVEASTKHKEQLEVLNDQTKQEIEAQANAHAEKMREALDAQKEIEASKVAAVEEMMQGELKKAEAKRLAEIDRKTAELNSFKSDAETRLAEEIAAREARLKKEEAAHEEQMKRLLAVADEKMTKTIMSNEEKRQKDLKIFNDEMDSAVKKAEKKMAEEIRQREEQIRKEEERHARELERVKKELEDKLQAEVDRLEVLRAEEREKYLDEVEQLNQECRVRPCCTM